MPTILTGDRPTGRLHLGHYVGSLRNRVELQNSGKHDIRVLVADMQALTDNANQPMKVKDNVIQVLLDYLAVGLIPEKTLMMVQSNIPALSELTMYYLNLVTTARLKRNPTVKEEIKLRGFDTSLPVGFFCYPISQAADITAFDANLVPVGEDQLPMIEQTREIVRTFNSMYETVLVEPEVLLPSKKSCCRLPGIDGMAKMSKTLGNCIYLCDTADEIRTKVMSMYTDPNHLRVEDPGNVVDNPVFIYLDAFCTDKETLEEMKSHYQRGGLGDVKVKRYLNDVLQAELGPIRERRVYHEKHLDYIYAFIDKAHLEGNKIANNTLERVKCAMKMFKI